MAQMTFPPDTSHITPKSCSPSPRNLLGVIAIVAARCGLEVEAVQGSGQRTEEVRARRLAMHLAHKILRLSYSEIARAWICAPTTVKNACEAMERDKSPLVIDVLRDLTAAYAAADEGVRS